MFCGHRISRSVMLRCLLVTKGILAQCIFCTVVSTGIMWNPRNMLSCITYFGLFFRMAMTWRLQWERRKPWSLTAPPVSGRGRWVPRGKGTFCTACPDPSSSKNLRVVAALVARPHCNWSTIWVKEIVSSLKGLHKSLFRPIEPKICTKVAKECASRQEK